MLRRIVAGRSRPRCDVFDSQPQLTQPHGDRDCRQDHLGYSTQKRPEPVAVPDDDARRFTFAAVLATASRVDNRAIKVSRPAAYVVHRDGQRTVERSRIISPAFTRCEPRGVRAEPIPSFGLDLVSRTVDCGTSERRSIRRSPLRI